MRAVPPAAQGAAAGEEFGLVHAGDADGGSDLSTGALIYQRIEEIERLLQRAEPVDRRQMVPGTVGVGSAVTVKWGEGDEETFMLVGPPEVSLRDSRISYESPVGRALVGRKAGDEIAVPVGQGLARLSVLHVAHDPAVL